MFLLAPQGALALLLAVPTVVAGPDLAEQAVAVEAPITAVTVYSDQARVVRTAEAPKGKGVIAIRFPDLPGTLALDSLRLRAAGGRVVRLEARPVQRSRRSIDQVDGLLTALEETEDQLAALGASRGILQAESKVLGSLRPAPLPPPDGRDDARARLSPDGWASVLDFIEARQIRIDTRLAELNAQIRSLTEQRANQRAELGEYDMAAFSARRIELTALIERTAAATRLEAEYRVPGAQWTPVYAIERAPGQNRITVRTAGMVTQTTGEDWKDVQVTLSTAMPTARIGMPALDTWTLGESRDFVLRPKPKRRDAQRRMVAVKAQVPMERQYAAWSLKRLRKRVAKARQERGVDQDGDGIADNVDKCPYKPETHNGVADEDGCPDQQRAVVADAKLKFDGDRVDGALKKPAPPPAPEPAGGLRFPDKMGMRGGAEFDADLRDEDSLEELIESELSIDSPEALQGLAEAELARNMDGFYKKRRRISMIQRPTPMSLYDRRVIGRGPVGPAGSPARLAGGLDYRYRATTRMTLPSMPEAQRVPLAVDTYPTTPFYAAAPGISRTAYLKATVQNQSGRPLLGGPVNIFVGTDFVGQGRLQTTGAGDRLDLPLGADEDIKIVRRVLPKTKTEGVFSTDDVTRYETVIEVGNYKQTPIRIRIAEQMPLAGHDKVKVKLGRLTPKPAAGPDAQGLMQFDLALKPGETGTIRFDYTVTRPENWRLRQR